MTNTSAQGIGLNLRAGEWVEVRSESEILATLDEKGRLENLPFMPEMLQSCGKRFRVSKRADKTCDNIKAWSLRRVTNAVHLDRLRCDGGGHDGCEAGCLIFWKEAWLRRVNTGLIAPETLRQPAGRAIAELSGSVCRCTASDIRRATRSRSEDREEIFSCQATELLNYTTQLAWWDIRQYIRDIRSGNLFNNVGGNARAVQALEYLLATWRLLEAIVIEAFNHVQRTRHGVAYQAIEGRLAKTPIDELNLQPGELVQVRSKDEIVATLDERNRNRGLLFEAEMLRWCGGIYRVLRRVHHIVDEKTGKMLNMKYPCIVLEGVACQGDYHRYCPKAVYHYWRESWLQRATTVSSVGAETGAPDCVQECTHSAQ